jgi:hypothetical protein
MGGFSSTTAGGLFALARLNTSRAFANTFGSKGIVLTKILGNSGITVLPTQASRNIVAIGLASDSQIEYLALARYLTK